MFDTSYDSVGAELPYVCLRSYNQECVASEGVRTLKYDTDKSYEPIDVQPIF